MSTKKDDGGPAFPSSHQDADGPYDYQQGMSLRDWFAGQALAFRSSQDGRFARAAEPGMVEEYHQLIAMRAYQLADAMLKARKA